MPGADPAFASGGRGHIVEVHLLLFNVAAKISVISFATRIAVSYFIDSYKISVEKQNKVRLRASEASLQILQPASVFSHFYTQNSWYWNFLSSYIIDREPEEKKMLSERSELKNCAPSHVNILLLTYHSCRCSI